MKRIFVSIVILAICISAFIIILRIRPGRNPASEPTIQDTLITSEVVLGTTDAIVPAIVDTVTASQAPTPYKIRFDGNVNCRYSPGSDVIVTTVRGQVITILAKYIYNQDWILVEVPGHPQCWMSNTVLSLPSRDLALLPMTESSNPPPTFTMPSVVTLTSTRRSDEGSTGVQPATVTPTFTPSRTPTTPPPPPPPPASYHVAISVKSVVKSGNSWTAIVTVEVHDGNHKSLSGAKVTTNWGTCTTGGDGTCDLSQISGNGTHSVTITVSDVSYNHGSYKPKDNHPDSLEIQRP